MTTEHGNYDDTEEILFICGKAALKTGGKN